MIKSDNSLLAPRPFSFNFQPFTFEEVYRELRCLDTNKSHGPDLLDPHFLKTAADFIAEPLTHIFNLTLSTSEIPKILKFAFVFPLFKGGDQSVLSNYRPISILSTLSKVLERLINRQLKSYLEDHEILSKFQSGYRKKHSTMTAALKVVNDISFSLDRKQNCASIFIDLSKAFDSVDHQILKQRLVNIGLSEQATNWISNYLSDRSQKVKCDNQCSDDLPIIRGVPQGSILGPLLFTIYINDVGQNVIDADCHFYADDMIIYSFASSLTEATVNLQKAFNVVCNSFSELKLSLNVNKTKLMLFCRSKTKQNAPPVVTPDGSVIEVVNTFKYLGVTIDDGLCFKAHIDSLVKKLRLKLSFYFRNKLSFSFNARKRLVAATFLPVLDYGDLLYMHATAQALRSLDSVFHASLRFITNCSARTHHCELYSRVGWPALATRRLTHWYRFIYKGLIGLLPSYLSVYLHRTEGHYHLRSQEVYTLTVPSVRTETGKMSFQYCAPTDWNFLQRALKIQTLVSLPHFNSFLDDLEMQSMVCHCF